MMHDAFPYPNGIASQSPGLSRTGRGYPGIMARRFPTLQGLCPKCNAVTNATLAG